MKVLEKICFLLFLTNVDSRRKEQHRPCIFNPLCTCSSSGPDLGSVRCHNIPFMTIPLHINESAIYIMSLKNNKLRFLEDNSLNGTGLWKLQINDNLLTNLPSSALAGLEKTLSILNLKRNELTRIPKEAIQNLGKLSNLNLAENHITFLYNDDLRNVGKTLKLLDLSNNALMHIQTDAFRNMNSLETLNLANNLILSIDDITFQNGLNNLKNIILMGNQLQQIPLNALANLKNINTVNLNDNIISTISEGREIRNRIYLEELHLENNLITELTPESFRLFNQVNKLFLKGNPLTKINDTFLTINATEIYIPHCKLSSITPNAFYSVTHSLQALDLSFNYLNEVPNFPFTKLIRLSLAGNEIKSINLENIKTYSNTLKYLDVRGSKMLDASRDILIDLQNLREYLFTKKQPVLDQEYLANIGPSMEKIFITKSSIKVIENGAFQRLTSLKELDLSHNDISKIENDTFKDIKHSLTKLILHKALRMPKFPYKIFNTLSKLEYLDISSNDFIYMSSESFSSFQNIKYLNLNYNKLKELPTQFFSDISNPNIEQLKIAFNKIISLNSHAFRNLQNLLYLELNDNLIETIKKSAFLDLDSIISIQLEGNLIDEIENEAFQNLPNIQLINLAYNKLFCLNLEAFHQVGRLSTLKIDVDHNNIQNLTADYTVMHTSSNIKGLNFSYNNISAINSNYFEPIQMSIVSLDLSHNKIGNLTECAFVNMGNLQILFISTNLIITMGEHEFKGVTALQILDLSYNYIRSFPDSLFEEQTKLRIFLSSHNNIEYLPERIFEHTKLEQLDLSFNNLEEFPQESLITIKDTLQYLDLSGNDIVFLNFSNFIYFQNLRHLSLSHNGLFVPSSEEEAHIPKLIYFDLSHNPLQDFPQWLAEKLPSSLETLNLANTSLKEIPILHSYNILLLNLSSNMIQTIDQEAIEQLQKIHTLDLSNNLLLTTYSNIWSSLQELRSLYLQKNPIQALLNTSFINMQRLQQLFIKDLEVQDIQKDVFYPLTALRKLEMDTYPHKDLNLSEMLGRSQGIKEVHLHVRENELEDLFDDNLPKSLKKITLEGANLRHIDESRFANIQSQDFQLDIQNSNITKLSQNLFRNMNEVKNFTAIFMNNRLQTIERLLHEKEIPSKYLRSVKLSENQLHCDCDLSWIWEWIKEYEYENKCDEHSCEDSYLHDLRDTKCANMNNRSLIDVFKTDLDCFSNGASSYLLQSAYSIVLSIAFIYLYINEVKI